MTLDFISALALTILIPAAFIITMACAWEKDWKAFRFWMLVSLLLHISLAQLNMKRELKTMQEEIRDLRPVRNSP